MKIGIIMRMKVLPHYYELIPKREKWFKGCKKIKRVEEAVYLYLKWKYPEHTFVKINPYKLNKKLTNSCDLVWQGMEDYTNLHKHTVVYPKKGTLKQRLLKHKKIWKGLMDIPNLFPSKEFTEFTTDKCNYYKYAEKLKINIVPTKCMKIKNLTVNGFLKFANKHNKVYIKPMPSGEGSGNAFFKKPYDKEEIQDYLEYVAEKGFHTLVVQQLVENWPKKRNPELRTVWVGHDYKYGVRTTDYGDYAGSIKRLPKVIRKNSELLISSLEKKFKIPLVTARIDWGKTPDGKYFLNEIEPMYSTFLLYHKNAGRLEVAIGERLIEVAEEMVSRKRK